MFIVCAVLNIDTDMDFSCNFHMMPSSSLMATKNMKDIFEGQKFIFN